MAFTNIPNGNLQVGAPLRSVDILALRDNIPAVMNGDTGAPKIKAAAFAGQSGAAPVFAVRTWASVNGFTLQIQASGNISSIARLGVGVYKIDLAIAMPDANYAVTGTTENEVSADNGRIFEVDSRTTSSFTAVSRRTNAQNTFDNKVFFFQVIR